VLNSGRVGGGAALLWGGLGPQMALPSNGQVMVVPFTCALLGSGWARTRRALLLLLMVKGNNTLPRSHYHVGKPTKACLVGLTYRYYFSQAATF